MAVAAATTQSTNPLAFLVGGSKGSSTRTLLRVIILCLIAGAAIASRLFSVIRKLLPGGRDTLLVLRQAFPFPCAYGRREYCDKSKVQYWLLKSEYLESLLTAGGP
jgi:hypothetical protein